VSRDQREHGFKSENLPWEFRPHALFVAFAPYDAPRYALSVVVEHGNAGALAAAPMARDMMIEVLTRDPAERREPQRVADALPAPGASPDAPRPGSQGALPPRSGPQGSGPPGPPR
jgi:hypothetical protein